MRGDLYRGKRIDNGEWIYWNRFGRLTDINGEPIRVEINTSALRPYAFYVNELPLIDEETVGQYTGLTDKNGVKIFEGDILTFVKGATRPFRVTWDGICWKMFLLDDGRRIKYAYEIDEIDYMLRSEVIGNIHDNPEFLKVMR